MGETAGLMRSAEVSFGVRASNLEGLTKTNEALDKLEIHGKRVNELLSKLGGGRSSQGLSTLATRLNKVNGNFDKLGKSMSESQSKFDGTMKSLADSSVTSTERISKAFSRTKTSVKDSLKGIPKSVNIKIKDNSSQTRESLSRTKKATTDYEKSSQRSMYNVSKHSGTAAKSINRVSKAGSALTDVGRTMTGATAAMGAGFLYAANQATKLQNQFTTVKNLVVNGGESMAEATRNVTKMQAQGAAMSSKYGTSQIEIAKGYEELVRRGYSSKQALAAQKTFLQGSIASGDSYADTVHNSTSALEQFGLRSNSTKKMTANSKKAVNEMAYAADLTATDFKGIGEGLRYAGATSDSAHQSLGNTAAALGDLSNFGQEGSIAGTGLRKVLNGLISPGKKSALPVLAQLGINPSQLKDSKGNLKNLVDIFDMLNAKMKGMTSTQRTDLFHTMFGTTGQETALILSQSTKQLRALNGQVAQSTKNNYIGKLSKQNMNSWQNQLKVFKSTATETGIEFAKTVLPTVTKSLKSVNGVLKSINHMSDSKKKLVTWGVVAAAAIGPLALSLGATAKAIGMINKGVGALPKGKIGSLLSANGSHSTGNAPVTTRSAKYAGATSTAGKWLNRAAILGIAADAGFSAVKAIREGVDTKKGGADMWHAAGSAVGGGIGLYLGGPAGAMIGTTIGGKISDMIAKTKIVASISAENDKIAKSASRTRKAGGNATLGTAGGAHVDGSFGATNRQGMQTSPNTTANTDAAFERARNGQKGVAKLDKSVSRGMAKNATALGKTTTRYDQMVSFDYDHQSLAKTKAALSSYTSANKKAYKDVISGAKSSIKSREKDSKSNLQSFVKSGLMSQSAADKAYKAEKSSYAKRVATARSSMGRIKEVEQQAATEIYANQKKHEANLSSITKTYAKKRKSIKFDETSELSELQRKGYVKINGSTLKGESGRRAIVERYDNRIKAANKNENSARVKEDKRSEKQRTQISDDANLQRQKAMARAQSKNDLTLSGNAKQQKAILTKMKNTSGKLSDQQASKMIKASYKTMNSTISHANKTYKSAKSAADKKYNATVKKAQQEYYQNGSISYKQYKSVIGHAKNQRDDAITAASDQKKETVRQAKDQHGDVVDQAKAQTKDHLASIDSETGQAKSLWKTFTGWLSGNISKISHFDTGVTTGFHSIKGELSTNKKIYKQPKKRTSSSLGVNKATAVLNGTSVTGHAAGGQITRTMKSLVGEGGVEAALDKKNGRMRLLGVNGPAVETLHAGETVLPAKHTAKLLHGGLGAGKTLPGYASGTSDVWSAVGKLYENADSLSGSGMSSDFASDPAGAAKKYIKGQGWDKIISKHGIQGKIVKAGKNALTKVASNALSKLGDKLEEASSDGAGVSYGAAGHYNPSLIRKAAKAMGQSLSASELQTIQNVIQHESGGNPSVVNTWDSNAKAGHPSRGLLQYVPSTFSAYSVSGHTNINSAYDQLLAMFNDKSWRSDVHTGGWGPTGGRLKANGGWATLPSIMGEVPGQPEMAINPYRSTADGQIMEVAKKRAQVSKGSVFNKLFSPESRADILAKVHAESPVLRQTNATTKSKGSKVTSGRGTIKIDMHPTINVYTNGSDGKQIGTDVAAQVKAVVQQIFQNYLDTSEGGTV
ncbi:phage tail tape measure protein [Lactobacillus brevis] [Lactiplantibacillus mudanjiangensis]|nr:phage tail tape measure protein [Lactobacillus brevis] [Lactiplantibacillus mudanjiangensis]